ncbi:MAG: UbiD family decarboxylase, partial [Clostridiales bacterium]|nr:UbiD family decarboxylase [Clostridiales bacterium]
MIDQHDTGIDSLRSAIEFLEKIPGQIIRTDVEVDPKAELSGVYRYVGAGGTVMRPTTIDGPAMIFNNVKGHQDARVIIGMMASRERVARMFGCSKENLGHLVMECAAHPIQPVVTGRVARSETEGEDQIAGRSQEPCSEAFPPCQEVIHLATDPDFDLNELIPAPTNTPEDAGPYITLGMCYA